VTTRDPAAEDTTGDDRLDPGQRGLGDMDPASFRRHGHDVVDWIADYLEHVGDLPVRSTLSPGAVRKALPDTPPEAPEPFDDALHDLEEVLLPGITHWNHPAFHAYFAITGSGPGILGETLTAALNVNGMLWRTSPSATELEEHVVDWLRQLLGLPDGLRGMLTDSASTSTLVALAAAREATDLDIRQRGLAGRADVPLLRIYTSQQAHSSIEKAVITLGLGRDGVRTIPTDETFRMDPFALEEAIAEDTRFGYRPMAIVPTVGTTSTTSIDPVGAIADVRDRVAESLGHSVWLHVDGAYGAIAGICDELRWVLDGVDRADSFVTNPHKWLFTPIDASVLFVRDPSVLVRAFSIIPEYLTTDDEDVTDFMDWGLQLGRRFRALKLWLVLRYFGADGLRARIRAHVAQARRVADWVDAHPRLERIAPVHFSTVCFRSVVEGEDDADADRRNRMLLDRINATGRVYLSHTALDGRYVLRLALGSLRTTEERLDETLATIDETLTGLLDGSA
jgi:aromatic-L-amino-acid/L-tryptophan decarboxylase